MQVLQSCENVFVIWLVWKIIKLRKPLLDQSNARVMDIFFILSGLMYSYVVFNFGTITRYKFPFVVCWLLINLMIIDKDEKIIIEEA